MIIDFHSHFLPGIDDGAKDCSMSLKMLKQSKDANVTHLVATPHYYIFENKSIDEALKLREESFESLKQYMGDNNFEMPHIYKGFEVYFSPKLKDMKDLDKLLIEGTNYMLVEMPYKKWDSELLEELYLLSLKDIRLVMAHIDRYYRVDKDSIYKLLELDVDYQVNADMLKARGERKLLDSIMQTGRLCVMGSDMHNTTDRATGIKTAYTTAQKKLKCDVKALFYDNAASILDLK